MSSKIVRIICYNVLNDIRPLLAIFTFAWNTKLIFTIIESEIFLTFIWLSSFIFTFESKIFYTIFHLNNLQSIYRPMTSLQARMCGELWFSQTNKKSKHKINCNFFQVTFSLYDLFIFIAVKIYAVYFCVTSVMSLE